MPKSSAPEDNAKAIKLGKRELPALEKAEFKVVAIGASAGGLEASRKLVDALPANSGMAFILVQHLDPTHPSLCLHPQQQPSLHHRSTAFKLPQCPTT